MKLPSNKIYPETPNVNFGSCVLFTRINLGRGIARAPTISAQKLAVEREEGGKPKVQELGDACLGIVPNVFQFHVSMNHLIEMDEL